MTKLAIVYHSGYGHTAKVAEHVLKGAQSAGIEAALYKADDLIDPNEGPWDALAAADGIIFGSPTYMGSASGPMTQFMDATSKVWAADGWKDKIAAGFTNSASLSGNKVNTLQQFATLAGQHGMIWVSFGMKSGYNSSTHDWDTAHNRGGFFMGLGTQSKADLPADQTPDSVELETAEIFGQRVAKATLRWAKGGA